MRNIDGSQWLRNPELRGGADREGPGPGSSFTLHADQVSDATAGCSDAAKAAKGKIRKASAGSGGAAMNLLEELRVTRPARSGPLAAAVPRRRGGAGFVVLALVTHLLVRVERSAPGAAAPAGRGAGAAAGVPRQACQGGQPRGLQAAAEGHRALLRRAAAAAARQDRGAEPAGGHLADRPRAPACRRSCSSPRPSRRRTSTPSCPSRSGSPAAITSSASS